VPERVQFFFEVNLADRTPSHPRALTSALNNSGGGWVEGRVGWNVRCTVRRICEAHCR